MTAMGSFKFSVFDRVKTLNLLPHQVTNLNFDVAISFKGKADFRRTSRRLIQENLT